MAAAVCAFEIDAVPVEERRDPVWPGAATRVADKICREAIERVFEVAGHEGSVR